MRKLKRTRLSFDEWLCFLSIRFESEGSTENLKLALTELEKFCGPLEAKEFPGAFREMQRIASGCLLCKKQRCSLLPPAHGRQHLRKAGALLRKGRALIIKNWALTLLLQEQYRGSQAEFLQMLAGVDEFIRLTRSAAQGKGEPELYQFGFRPSSLEKFYTLVQSYCLLRIFAGNRKLGLTKDQGPLVRFTAALYRYATGEKTRGGTFSRSLEELRRALPEIEKVLAARRRASARRPAKPESKSGRGHRRPRLALVRPRTDRLRRRRDRAANN